MSEMSFQKRKQFGWGWVGGVSSTKFFWIFLDFFNFTKPLRGFANIFFKSEFTMGVGGSGSHSGFFLNHPKIALNQYSYFGVHVV